MKVSIAIRKFQIILSETLTVRELLFYIIEISSECFQIIIYEVSFSIDSAVKLLEVHVLSSFFMTILYIDINQE